MPLTPLRCRPKRRLRRVGVRQWPRARFRRAALASAAVRPHGQGVSASGPACNATRHGSEASSIPGRSPVAAWPQESTRQPPRRSSYEPPSDSMWLIVPSAGRLPARHRDYGGSGTGLRLSAPTSASADHAACGSSVDGGTIPPRHESRTKISVSTILAATGPKADFAACHYPFRANPHPFAGRVVTGGNRGAARPSPRWPSNARSASYRLPPSQGTAIFARGARPPRHRRGCGGRGPSAMRPGRRG